MTPAMDRLKSALTKKNPSVSFGGFVSKQYASENYNRKDDPPSVSICQLLSVEKNETPSEKLDTKQSDITENVSIAPPSVSSVSFVGQQNEKNIFSDFEFPTPEKLYMMERVSKWPDHLKEFWKKLAWTFVGRYCLSQPHEWLAFTKIMLGEVKLPFELVIKQNSDDSWPLWAEELNQRVRWVFKDSSESITEGVQHE